MDLTKEMKQVYAPYCRNHDDVITLLEKVCVAVFLLILASPKVFTRPMKVFVTILYLKCFQITMPGKFIVK